MGDGISSGSRMQVLSLLPFLLLALTHLPHHNCDQTHHQSIQHGAAPAVVVSVHKAHGAHHASVATQPHASPQSVHGHGYAAQKQVVAVHAPAAVPTDNMYHTAAYHASAPAYHAPAVIFASPAPAYHAPAPAYHAPAPAYHAPAPAYQAPAPAYHAPAPAYKAAPAYEEPSAIPAKYTYEYAVADDYSKSAFNANENR